MRTLRHHRPGPGSPNLVAFPNNSQHKQTWGGGGRPKQTNPEENNSRKTVYESQQLEGSRAEGPISRTSIPLELQAGLGTGRSSLPGGPYGHHPHRHLLTAHPVGKNPPTKAKQLKEGNKRAHKLRSDRMKGHGVGGGKQSRPTGREKFSIVNLYPEMEIFPEENPIFQSTI